MTQSEPGGPAHYTAEGVAKLIQGLEEDQLGAACPMFMHSFNDSEGSTPLFLHPQMLADAETVVEMCTVFLTHWDKRNVGTNRSR